MPEHLFTFGFLAGCLVWVPVTIWIVAMIGWMVQGEIDLISGTAAVILGLVMGALSLIKPDVAPMVFFAALCLVVVFPFARAAREKRELAKIDVEAMERAYDMLRERPDNIGPKLRIAKTLYNRGAVGHAAAIAEASLKTMPKSLFEEEHRLMKSWQRAAVSAPASDVLCVECGAYTKPGEIYCKRCGAPVLLHYAKGSWISGSLARRLLAAWIAAVACVVGIPIAASSLSPKQSAGVVIILLTVSALVVWTAFRPGKADA